MKMQADIRMLRRDADALACSVRNGAYALKTERLDDRSHYGDMLLPSVLTLHGVPIVQMKTALCPTCSGLLAAGYGLSTADAGELSRISEAVNADFVGLAESLEILKPLLGLLPDGIYLLRDTVVYPTDGEGRFFWAVPPEMTHYRAYSESIYSHETLTCVSADGRFLYPSQSPGRYSAERVQYYTERLQAGRNAPRAVAYHVLGGMSVLLDGHHKACAAARLHIPLRCLVISPYYPVSIGRSMLLRSVSDAQYDLELTADCIPKRFRVMYEAHRYDLRQNQPLFAGTSHASGYQPRQWEPCYHEAMLYYPDAEDYVAETVCHPELTRGMTPAELCLYMQKAKPEFAEAGFCTCVLLKRMLRERDPRCRETARLLTKQEITPETKSVVMQAMQVLAEYPDAETEQILIDLYVTGDREIAALAAELLPGA